MKTNFVNKFLVCICFIALLCGNVNAQLSTPRPSPNAIVSQNIGLADVKVAYSRPQMKGRKIFGGVVAYNKMWRTGANSPTKVSITDTISINGVKVVPGDYALYTIPGEAEWTIIFGKNPNVSAGEYKDDQDAARFKVKPETLPSQVETFTIGFSNLTNASADFEISWEKTLVRFKITNDYDAKVMAQINEKMGVDANLYYQAGSYYNENNKDLNKALEWVTKATDKNPQFYMLHTKAVIQQKLKDCKSALVTAQKSIELSKKANNDEYVKFNEKLISDCGVKK